MERILQKLDAHLAKNDTAAAERHLLYWRAEKQGTAAELTLLNELMGLYRKMGEEEKALRAVDDTLALVQARALAHTVTGATACLNAATVLHAFGRAEDSLPLFEKAKAIYEKELDPADTRLGGLCNNMATALVSLGRFKEARTLNERAIAIMATTEEGSLEVAVTYLNMASAAEAERGALAAEEEISRLLDKAEAILLAHKTDNGYYAFVLSKCIPVLRYFGRFRTAEALEERMRRIYEGT